jgi:hypothetical protein
MRTPATTFLTVMSLSGCVSAVDETAALDRLDPLVTRHAAALGADDVSAMRRSGFDLISAFDAARGPR